VTAALDATQGDVRQVQKISRHTNLDALMIYDDNRQDAQGSVSKMLADLI
jgi:integrase/recombinase XerC